MDRENLRAEIEALLDPQPDEPGDIPREWPHSRLKKLYGLDCEYLGGFVWEGASAHPDTRLCPVDETRVHAISQNTTVAVSLMKAALRIFAESIITYFDLKARSGPLRFYPPAILTFWSGLEAFVRHSSELMLETTKGVPPTVAYYLRETEFFLDRKMEVQHRTHFRPVIERYAALLRYGYGLIVDKGDRYWQGLVKAKALRDYYTHVDVGEPRAVSSGDVLEFLEAVLIAIIWPSSLLRRTLLLGVYDMYAMVSELRKFAPDFAEQPLHLGWPRDEPYLLRIPFNDVDTDRFPNLREKESQ
ncbi:MAG: hypothetical protein ACYTKD_02665 [Planctomycetota bacterium]|jgi:hypothetical protein